MAPAARRNDQGEQAECDDREWRETPAAATDKTLKLLFSMFRLLINPRTRS
jgi:hypothetical protein